MKDKTGDAILSAFFALACSCIAGMLIYYACIKGDGVTAVVAFLFIVIGALFLVVSHSFVDDVSTGRAINDTGSYALQSGEVYETLGSVRLENEQHVVVLRDREGTVWAYAMAEVPPACFKKVSNGNYKKYPA